MGMGRLDCTYFGARSMMLYKKNCVSVEREITLI
jgi:hypothetical protein